MARRSVLALLALLLVPWLDSSRALADDSEPGKRPDIIVVMVDDLGAIGERVLERLPNIRKLWLQQGLKFDSAYSETPLCCPGRAAFLTGQHTRRHGVVVNDARLLDPGNTIATALDEAGYFTVMAGKYLNGAALLTDHTPPGWDRVAMLNTWEGNVSSEWWVQDVPQSAGYFDRFAADKALEWMTAAPSDQPLFMWLTPHAPHEADAVLEEWITDIEPRYVDDPRCEGIRPWRPDSYSFPRAPEGFPLDDICRSLLTVDDMVGELQAEAAGQGRDPFWLFTSDNGMSWGAHGFALKNVPSADRLPLYVAGPGVVNGATSALVSNIDIAPTLAELAGVELPRADGMSFERVLRGESGRRRAMLQDHPVGGPTGLGDLTGPWWGIRTRKWHLVVWNGTHLYQTQNDRWELDDIALDNPDTALRLAGMWRRLMGEHGPARPPFPAVPVPTPTPQPTPTSEPTPTSQPGPTHTPEPAPTAAPPSGVSPGASPSAPTRGATPAVPSAASPSTRDSPGPTVSEAAPSRPSPIVPGRNATSGSAGVLLAIGALACLAGALTVPAVRRRLR